MSSAASGPKPKEVTGSPVEVGKLEPNTNYNISLTVKFEGGGFGPPVLLMTTTPEDGKEEGERKEKGERRCINGCWQLLLSATFICAMHNSISGIALAMSSLALS